MQFKKRIIDEQLCVIHFYVSAREANKIYEDVHSLFKVSLEEEVELFYDYLQEVALGGKLAEMELVSIGEKKYRYLCKYTPNRPIIGVCTFLLMQDEVDLSIPVNIPKYVTDKIEADIECMDDEFKSRLINNEMCFLEEQERIDDFSLFDYELVYTKDGKVLNTIKDQQFDMYYDDDMRQDKFLGCKVNDRVLIDEDEITIEALITRIRTRVPYSKTHYDEAVLRKKKYKDFDDLASKFAAAYKKYLYVTEYIEFIVDFTLEHSKMKFSKSLIDFYREKDVLPFEEYDLTEFDSGLDDSETFDDNDEEDDSSFRINKIGYSVTAEPLDNLCGQRVKNIKRSYIHDLLCCMTKFKSGDYEINSLESFTILKDSLLDYDNLQEDVFLGQKIYLIDYFTEQNIIKGLKKY